MGIILLCCPCLFWHSLSTSLVALLVLLRPVVRSRVDLQVENLALRHQIGVLQRSLKRRPKISAMDRVVSNNWNVSLPSQADIRVLGHYGTQREPHFPPR
jgi:hypothetical protein